MRLIFAFCVACLGCTTANTLANQNDDGGGTDGDAVLPDLSTSQPDLTQIMTMPDLANPQSVPDLSSTDFGGVSCGNSTCGMAQECCVTRGPGGGVTAMCVASGACADGGISAMCDGPEDCGGGTPNCCATLTGNMMTPSGGAACTATCEGNISGGMGGGFTVRTKLCHSDADCTGYSGTFNGSMSTTWDACCYNNNAPQGGRFCANPMFATFGGYTCN